MAGSSVMVRIREGSAPTIAIRPQETEALEQDALASVTAGIMLNVDGLFYYGTQGGHLVLRRKCDGSAVGRVDIVEVQIPMRVSMAGG